ncbi:hypothetical protein EHS25_003313 [Saitozyma podzolica]|uniref:HhH-GPD domain-containing protein n=1 Tax=Saitozyma podzolica TaxID=1890683 RepID=A0A427Y8L1_9TREE|nr:hypothetical protein EHS25_003313 [Saitozyma podzolica]
MPTTPNGTVSPYFVTPSRVRRPLDGSSPDTDTSEDEDEDEETPPPLFSYSVMPSFANDAGRRRSSRLSLPAHSHRPAEPVEPVTPISNGRRKKRRVRHDAMEAKEQWGEGANARSAGTSSMAPPTPESLPRRKPRAPRPEPIVEIPIPPPSTPTRATRRKRSQVETSTSTTRVVVPNERGLVEPVGKIHLIQEKVRHDPWRMLVATSLLNKTAGRAAIPIYWELLRRWPNADALSQASVSDLAALLYPLGLFNQRASSLVRFSQQYLQLSWPLVSSDASGLPVTIPAPIPIFTPSPISRFSPSPKTEPLPEDLDLDVRIFFGAGIYASDSFRIYSDLLPGRGGPEKEGKWVKKWERARRRRQARGIEKRDEGLKEIPEAGSEDEEDVGSEQEVQGDVIPGVEDLAGWISDEEGDDSADEWRKVRPTDKELRRYLIWRWGLEGIAYDIYNGPRVILEKDRRRLGLD